jgi:hypothetical protein
MLPSYKTRFRNPVSAVEGREAGYGLVALALRHEKLRSEIWRVIDGRRIGPSDPPWLEAAIEIFPQITRVIDEKEDELRPQGLMFGRERVVEFMGHLPESSPHRYADPSRVPDDLVLPSLFSQWGDGLNGERAADYMVIMLLHAARARAEDFYYPASFHRAFGPWPVAELAETLVAMRRTLAGERKPVLRGEQPGRNDPCPCGSGKKYKKCHGR